MLTCIILTLNEEIHLKRCLQSISKVCERIVIVDSNSSDKTELIAKDFGADFYKNNFINYSTQFNWALKNCSINSEWVLRIDADEYLSDELQADIQKNLKEIPNNINGIYVKRLMYFLNKPLKMSGMYPIWHIKIWRNNSAVCEQRWMDERMVLKNGETIKFKGDLIDHNLNNLTWWTQKHNNYSTREAIDILDKIYNFTNHNSVPANLYGNGEERRRWFKERYLNLPLFIRPFLFWFIRYFFQGGFLEGKNGFIWNTLQCLWYRFLVDIKIYEAYKKAGRNKIALINYFKSEYGYDITKVG